MAATKPIRHTTFDGVRVITLSEAVDRICSSIKGIRAFVIADRLLSGKSVVYADPQGRLEIYCNA